MINQPLHNRYIQSEARLVELLQRLFASNFCIEVNTLTGGIFQSCNLTLSLTREFRKMTTITY